MDAAYHPGQPNRTREEKLMRNFGISEPETLRSPPGWAGAFEVVFLAPRGPEEGRQAHRPQEWRRGLEQGSPGECIDCRTHKPAALRDRARKRSNRPFSFRQILHRPDTASAGKATRQSKASRPRKAPCRDPRAAGNPPAEDGRKRDSSHWPVVFAACRG